VNEVPLYWRVFNFMVRRVVAVGFVVVGGLIAISNVPSLVDPDGTVLVNGQPQSDLFYRIFVVVLPAVIAVLGVLLYRSAPFAPKMTRSET
jgi:hypothetical protein